MSIWVLGGFRHLSICICECVHESWESVDCKSGLYLYPLIKFKKGLNVNVWRWFTLKSESAFCYLVFCSEVFFFSCMIQIRAQQWGFFFCVCGEFIIPKPTFSTVPPHNVITHTQILPRLSKVLINVLINFLGAIFKWAEFTTMLNTSYKTKRCSDRSSNWPEILSDWPLTILIVELFRVVGHLSQ